MGRAEENKIIINSNEYSKSRIISRMVIKNSSFIMRMYVFFMVKFQFHAFPGSPTTACIASELKKTGQSIYS